MPIIKTVNNNTPKIGNDCFIAENATILGKVEIGDKSSVWYNAIIRGDVNSISIGEEVNIQDGAVVHCTFETAPTVIGNRVSLGHNAIVHGCTLKDDVLIGMGSIVMDGVIVESNSIVAAGAVVLEGTHIPSGVIYAGVPAKQVKIIDEAQAKEMIGKTASQYVKYSAWFK